MPRKLIRPKNPLAAKRRAREKRLALKETKKQ